MLVPGAHAQTATNGPRTLSVSKSQGLNPEGDLVTVTGSGFDVEKGIYVAFCLVPAPGQAPSPCGGGADLSGSGGASAWISSNPPSYGEGLAVPYGEGGTFTVTIGVSAALNPSLDCRQVQCAVVTRSDHTRINDRSQDVIVPVSFGTPATPTATAVPATPQAPTPTAPPAASSATAPATPTVSPTTPAPSPTATPTATPAARQELSSDGRTATARGMSLTVAEAGKALLAGTKVTVTGRGYDEARGVYVALCAIPAPGAAPSHCSSGSTDASVSISSDPPEYGRTLARPYTPGGAFEAHLVLDPVVDGATDCRNVKCAVMTRSDDTAPADRSQDLMVPVELKDAPAGTPEASGATVAADAAGGDGGGGATWPWILGGGAAAVVVLGSVLFVGWRRLAGGTATTMLAVLLLAGCTGGDSTPVKGANPSAVPGLPVTVHSADGRDVVVKDSTRIVSLWGNITDVLFDLGLGDHVVGRDVASTLPGAADIPVVTRAHDVSPEGVLSLDPTLVVGSMDNSGPATALDHIRNVGVPVVLFEDPTSVDEIIPRIEAIARAVGVPEKGVEYGETIAAALEAARASVPRGQPQPRVAFLYLRGQAGVYLLGGPKSGADSMITAAGGVDAGTAMGLDRPFTPITSEALAQAAPDIILLMTSGLDSVGGVDGLVRIPGIAQTPAGKARRVVALDDDLLYNFGRRTPVAIETLSKAFYPGQATP